MIGRVLTSTTRSHLSCGVSASVSARLLHCKEKNVPFHAPSVWGIAWGCGPRPQGELRGKADESGGTVGPQPFVPAQMAQRSAEYLPAVITHGTWRRASMASSRARETAGGRGRVAKGSWNRGDGKVFTFFARVQFWCTVNHIKSNLESRRIKLEKSPKLSPLHPIPSRNPVLPLDSAILSKDWMRRL